MGSNFNYKLFSNLVSRFLYRKYPRVLLDCKLFSHHHPDYFLMFRNFGVYLIQFNFSGIGTGPTEIELQYTITQNPSYLQVCLRVKEYKVIFCLWQTADVLHASTYEDIIDWIFQHFIPGSIIWMVQFQLLFLQQNLLFVLYRL